MREVAIRGFINNQFGSPVGKGLFKKALYTGSVELHNPWQKYLVDFFTYEHWEHSAKTDDQMQYVRKLSQTELCTTPNVLMSWIKHYDRDTKKITPAQGFCLYAQDSQDLHLCIADSERAVEDEWTLDVQICKSSGAKSPVFIAANVDLTNWH